MSDEFDSGPSITRVRLSEELSDVWRIEAETDPRFREGLAPRVIRVARELAKVTEDLILIEDSEGVELSRVG